VNLITYQNPFSKNYYFHKIRGYYMVAQTIVNYEKQFTNTFVNMFRIVKDICVFLLFGLYSKTHNSMVFFDPQEGCQDGIPLYVSNAKGFMLFNG
jgi:hypothetical protein